ncbi:hypothetical protein BS629_09085 [Rhizobium leguminosarum bv. viciae USDA 2370]|nr:hypothetical protein BS629_09085 [Rhizobium leguminosarum bv. viciae USDA 2370]
MPCRRASQHTCAAYAYSFQLLLSFAAARLGTTPSRIEIEQFDAPLLLGFLERRCHVVGNLTGGG